VTLQLQRDQTKATCFVMEVSLNPGLGISCVHDLVALMTVSGFSAQKILVPYLKPFWRKGHARSDKVRYLSLTATDNIKSPATDDGQ
jgi:hypothetical protein